jgi:hypothetical protein
MRREVLTAVAEHPRPATNLQWLAVAAAVLLGFAVVGGLMSSRLAHPAPVPGHQKVAPLVDYGPPPAGVPLVYVVDPRNYAWLQGYDWQGKARATVKVAGITDGTAPRIAMAPDGSAFTLDATGKGGGIYLDRLGNSIPAPSGPPVDSTTGYGQVGGLWADDGRHLCSVGFNQLTFVWTLGTLIPGQAVRTVAVIARDSNVGQTAISVEACSVKNDSAILVRTTVAWPSEIWVVKLTSGQVLSHHTYPGNQLGTVVGSPDGAYIAETSAKASPQTAPSGADTTVIRRVSDWTVVGVLPATDQVLGFSGDGSRVLISGSSYNPYLVPSHLQVVDWQFQRSLWSYNGPEALGSFSAQPGGSAFAVALKSPPTVVPSPCINVTCQVVDEPLRDVVIVHADGSTTNIAGRFVAAW